MLIALIGHDDDGTKLAVRDDGQPGGNADALAVEQAHDVIGAASPDQNRGRTWQATRRYGEALTHTMSKRSNVIR